MKLETMVLGPLETNCYLLWDEQTMEAAVIDPGASGQKIADRLAQNGLMLRMILLTHAHFDHIGGLQQLHELTGAPVWVSKIDSADPAEMTHGRLIFTNTYEWCADGVKSAMDGLQSLAPDDMPVWYKIFSAGGKIIIENLDDVRASMPSEYEILRVQDIKSEIA